jgi:hypothetical protein
VNPDPTGTKAAFRYRLEIGAGDTAVIRLLACGRRRHRPRLDDALAARRERPTSSTRADAAGATDDEALVLRQAFGGMLWTKQFYHYDVRRWLDGDPAFAAAGVAPNGRNQQDAPEQPTSCRCPTLEYPVRRLGSRFTA